MFRLVLLPLLLPLLLLHYSYAQTCTSPANSLPGCSNTALIVVDTTNYMTSDMRLNEMTYLNNQYLRHLSLSYGQQAAVIGYGSGPSSEPMTSSIQNLCSQLDTLDSQAVKEGGQKETIQNVLQRISNTYMDYTNTGFLTVTLFSASTNTTDIALSSTYATSKLPAVSFTIVDYSGSSDNIWKGFPYKAIYRMSPETLANSGLAQQMACNSCQQCYQSDPITPTQPPVTTPAPLSDGPACSTCNMNNLWLDIMLLFDVSTSTSVTDRQTMFASIQRTLSYSKIGLINETYPYHVRLGVITYDQTAQLVYPLGTLGAIDFYNLQLNSSSTNINNLQPALTLATSQFQNNTGHRANVRPITIIFSTTYQGEPSDQYLQAANDYKQNAKNILIVYEQIETVKSRVFQQIASPGYYISSDDDTDGSALQQALCTANCFCATPFHSYRSNMGNGMPLAGCYVTKPTSNFNLAKNLCDKDHNGIVAEGKTLEKSRFLASIADFSNFWAGMWYDPFDYTFLWMDGTFVNSNPYQPWLSNYTDGNNCVFVTTSNTESRQPQWVPVDCRNSYTTVCEMKPCDTMHYCDDMY